MPFTVIIPPNVTQPQACVIPDATENDYGVIKLSDLTFTGVVINNGTITNSTIDNSTITNSSLDNVIITNGTLINPSLTNPTIVGWLALASFSDATRPLANTIPAGGMIFNTDDTAPNISDGTVWRDMDGEQT